MSAIYVHKPNATPTYPGFDYSKGPKESYFTEEGSDKWLKLYINIAQTDTDDEWGRTESIAIRSIIDHVTGLWQTICGDDPETNPAAVDSVVGAIDSILTIVKIDSTPANSNITIGTVVLDKDGLRIGTHTKLIEGELNIADGVQLIGGTTAHKYVKFHTDSLDNFYLKFSSSGYTNNLLTISIPTSTTTSNLYIFSNNAVSFDIGSTFTAGNSILSSVTTAGYVSASLYMIVGIDTTTKLDGSSIIVGNNTAIDRITLNLTEGLIFTCSNVNRIEMVAPGFGSDGWIKYRCTNGIERMYLRSGTNNLLGLRGGANLRFVGQDPDNYDSVAAVSTIRAEVGTSGSFDVYATIPNTRTTITNQKVEFYTSPIDTPSMYIDSVTHIIYGDSHELVFSKDDILVTKSDGTTGKLRFVHDILESDNKVTLDSTDGLYFLCNSGMSRTIIKDGNISFGENGISGLQDVFVMYRGNSHGGIGYPSISDLYFPSNGIIVAKGDNLRVLKNTDTTYYIDINAKDSYALPGIKFYAANTLKAAMFVDVANGKLALESSSGVINIESMPKSATGLVTGDLWNNGGYVCIIM